MTLALMMDLQRRVETPMTAIDRGKKKIWVLVIFLLWPSKLLGLLSTIRRAILEPPLV